MTDIIPDENVDVPRVPSAPANDRFLHTEGMALLEAYKAIPNPQVRDAVRGLILQIAEASKKE